MTRFEKKIFAGILSALMLVTSVGTSGYVVSAAEVNNDKSMEAVNGAFSDTNEEYNYEESENSGITSGDITVEDNIVGADKDNNAQEEPAATETGVVSEDGLYVYNVYGTDGIGIASYNGTDTDITLPSQIDGKTVVSIDKMAFMNNKTVTKVVIPNTVTNVQYSAFERTTNLNTVEFAEGSQVKTIDKAAFYKSGVTHIGILDGTLESQDEAIEHMVMPSTVTQIQYAAFGGTSNLKKIEFAKNGELKTIGDSAFANSGITYVNIPDSAETIGDLAFLHCSNLESAIIGAGDIGYRAFYNCKSLEEVELLDTVVSIGNGAFANSRSLSKVVLSNNLVNIPYWAFYDCPIEKIYIGDNTEVIDSLSFAYDKVVKNIILNDGLKEIKKDAFLSCELLDYIYIPESVTTIGERAVGYIKNQVNYKYQYDKKDNFIIYGAAGSAAEEYANTNGFTFIAATRDELIANGILEADINGLQQAEDGNWYYYKHGEVSSSYTGLASYNDMWFYVSDGMVDWGYTGLVYYNDVWFYVSNGMIDWNYAGLVYYNDMWFYVSNGTIDWGYTGLTYYNDTWFYVSNGMLDWNYTGLTYYNDMWFYVSSGMVDWGYYGLVNYNGAWFFVSDGTINWTTTLVEYDGMWFYVSGGVVDWNYTGTYEFYGNTFNIVGGVVVW